MAGGGLLIWLICFWKRKNPIGGWLLYYFITLFVGFFISIALTLAPDNLSNFNPMLWDDKIMYFFFIVTTVPSDALLLAQIVLTYYLLSSVRRDWKHILILRNILLAEIILSLVSIPIDMNYWPDTGSAFFSGYALVVSSIWYFYFKKSVRVEYVFKHKNWNWDTFHPSKSFAK
ncbi:hypothetical protein BMS3Abin10_01651 [bacterium BMS3Abin10]|nr:hypothetical protein BMS3Abin10_01651 [bacterium BMS3Abin10]